MKKLIPILLLCAAMLLAGCTGKAEDGAGGSGLPAQPPAAEAENVPDPGEGQSGPAGGKPAGENGFSSAAPEDAERLTCRIIDGADTRDLILAGADGGDSSVYLMSCAGLPIDWGKKAAQEQTLRDGMLVEIAYTGGIQETFPALIGSAAGLTVLPGTDDLCSLYLDVLEKLWSTDEGLNSDITELGVDLSQTRLTPSEQAAVAYAFGQLHGLLPIQGTLEELTARGYITLPASGETGDCLPYWENGCLFTIREQDPSGTGTVKFDAEKWRSGIGADFFTDCSSTQNSSGEWSDYEIGSYAIS